MSSGPPASEGQPSARSRAWLPLVVLVVVVLGVYGLSRWHVFQPSADAGGPVAAGDATAGAQVYAASCAGCHGAQGEGGVGPALQGRTDLSPEGIQAVIRSGRGVMPAGLVSGEDEADVIAFLQAEVLGP